MMMAPDTTPGRPSLSAESVDALRSALEEFLASGREIASLQPTLRRIAVEARTKKILAEQLLVLLKDVWYALPQMGRAAGNEPQNILLQRVITLCIREYYSS
jgi:hypothetical protein